MRLKKLNKFFDLLLKEENFLEFRVNDVTYRSIIVVEDKNDEEFNKLVKKFMKKKYIILENSEFDKLEDKEFLILLLKKSKEG